MMVVYLPVKFVFDWTKRFELEFRKRNVDGQTNGQKTDTRKDGITLILKET